MNRNGLELIRIQSTLNLEHMPILNAGVTKKSIIYEYNGTNEYA